ncbi:hybrid sensor histidine kinase/response regulator [Halovenus sp. HT40]|uniref:hybrid sensor histidine kinase/response regulator n=1 Tax=Halovenus sp. HT40 TaxID=3126691 RepID=UPI00300EC3DF
MTDGANRSLQESEFVSSEDAVSEYRDRSEQCPPRVLLVDDRTDLSARFGQSVDVRAVADEQAALAVLAEADIDCLLVSDRLEADVVEFITSIRSRDCAVPIGLLAFDGSESLAGAATRAGVSEYIPVESGTDLDLLTRVDSLLEAQEGLRSVELDGIEAAIEHAADAVVITDDEGVIEYVNPAFENLTEYDRAEAIGRTPRILKSGEQGQAYYEQMWETILDGKVWEETIINETRSGEQYIAHQTVAPVTGADGAIERFVGIQRDITRQQRLEEQVERSETTLSRLYDITAHFDGDLETKIETVLQMAAEQLGYEIGYFTRIADDKQEILAAVGDHESIEAGKTDPLERTYCRKTIESDEPVIIGDAVTEGWEGDPAVEEFGLRCYAGARVLVDEELYGTLCFGGREPTDRLILDAHKSTVRTLANWVGYEIEREQYSRKLEQQNERLERFASAVSHDLRNPLTVAQSYVSLARSGDTDADALDNVAEAHQRMEGIIDDTLTLAREGELVEEPATVSLRSIATDCWQHVDTEDASLDVETETTLRADPDKLRHVFENLFCNAITHGGSDVTVRVGALQEGFYVEDDGPGIDDDAKDEVFEFGYTADEGSGFGLAIVETVAQAHDWRVRVTDSDAGGARFEFETDGSTDRCFVC